MPKKPAKDKQPAAPTGGTFFSLLGKGGMGLVRPATTGRNMGVLPTGNLSFDILTGRGGLKGGTITIVTGDSGVGKSTLCYRAAAQAQARGMAVLIWDTESRYQPDIAEANGVDLQEFVPPEERTIGVVQWSPYAGTDMGDSEAVLKGNIQEIQKALRIFFTSEPAKSKGALFIIDSINFPRSQDQEQGQEQDDGDEEGEDGEKKLKTTGEGGGIALLARIMHNWMPEFLGYVHRPNNYCIMTRQKRTKIAKGKSYGPTVAFSGGRAIEYSVSLDVVMDKIGKLIPTEDEKKADIERHGDLIRITSRKNTAGFPNRMTYYDMTTLYGIDDLGAVIRYGVKSGFVELRGSLRAFRLSNGEWSKSMYAKDAQQWFWASENNQRELAILMSNIRDHYSNIPKQRIIGNDDSIGDTSNEQEGEYSDGEPEPVPPDTA